MKRRGVLLAVVLAVAVMIFGGHTQAQNNGELNLTSSPLPVALKAKPGESIGTDLRIRNSGTKAEKLKVGLMKFSAASEDGKPQLEERGAGDDYFDWVTFSETEFTAEPNEWKTIKMTIRLPQSAAFGYYYAATFTRAEQEQASGNLQSAIRGGSATLVLLEADVKGAKRELSIESFSVGKRTYEFLPAKFNIKLRNKGNVHAVPSGNVFIKQGSKQIATIGVNSADGNILPNSNRIFSPEWSDGFPVYEAKQENGQTVMKDGKQVYGLNWDIGDIRKLRFGKYTATLVMVYNDGSGDVPLEATLSFWVVPWRIIIFGFFILLFAGIGIWVTARKGLLKVRRPAKFKPEK
jgi:hypothetical protein